MTVKLKKHGQIERMRRAGQVVHLVLQRLGEMMAPGLTTKELDVEAERLALAHGAQCLFKGVPSRGGAGPFPASICASLNEEVVHGIPADRVIRDGDIVSIDFGVKLDGWCGDAAVTYIVGNVSGDVRRLVNVTRNSLEMVVRMCRPGEKWSNIARVIQNYIENEGFSVVRDYVGHGIGAEMHEEPKVPNFLSRELQLRDVVLEEGMVLAVEPMVNMGTQAVKCAADGWTIVTQDGMPSAHFEHTLAVTADGVDVLTG